MMMGDRIVVMSAGNIAQIGTPQEVFLTPADIAVARTIGSPAMNLLDGTATATGGALVLEGAGWRLALSDDAAAALARELTQPGQAVTMGIRPEDLEVGPTDSLVAPLGSGPCVVAEPLGSETLYNIQIADQFVRALRRETHVSLPEGSATALGPRSGARCHVFDAGSGIRLASVLMGADGYWQVTQSAAAA